MVVNTLCSRLPLLPNIIVLLLFTTISDSTNSNSDLNALLSFKSLITKDPMGALSSWDGDASNRSAPHFCRWNGVTCSSDQHGSHVTALRLRAFGLEGNISQSLGNLSHLQTLDLSNNNLEGEIPSSIGNLFALHSLNLSVNHLSGNVPQSIGRLSELEILNFRDNDIVGSIPSSVLNLTGLTMLSATENYMTGRIPDWLGNLTDLTDLNLAWNNFSGQIPQALGKLTNLARLTMQGNQLEGLISPTLFNISSLEILDLGYNKLSGSLPPDIGFTLPNIVVFNVCYTKFEGPVPSSLSNISVLQQLILHGNRFHGRIPPNIGVHGSLTNLELGNNQLQVVDTKDWDFLTPLVNCSHLKYLNLELNSISGILPNAVSNLSYELEALLMGGNQITGTVPSGIGRLQKLQILDLSDNLFTGAVPSSIGKLSSLDSLVLFSNKFDGEIPSSLGNLTKLTELVLYSNDLHGSMPPSLGNMTILESIDLSYNRLSGQIPQEILSMYSLTKFLNLSNNFFSGPISQQIRLLISLGTMDLSSNNLSGEIPHTLGSCVTLQFLYLQGNLLQGQIPVELNALRGLEVLDISSNNLSGPIPDFLGDFQVLKKLNLSFNNLSGPVLDRGIFHNNATSVSLSGNAMLCGGPGFFQLPPCSTQATYGRSNHQRMHVLAFSFTGALVVFVCITACYFMKRASDKASDAEHGLVTLPRNKYKRISYAELYEATDSFSDSNLVGRGRFGTVYKGILHDDSNTETVAVKVLDLKQQGASRTFFTECDALKRIKHRKLVKVITVCDSLDNNGDEFKALVLEFIPNGTLDEWLHPSALVTNRATGSLSIIQRLNIALDVAEALAYLHHHSNPSIVHCDIKPSNILLDENMTAHVGDFGLARILNMDACEHNSGGSSSAGIRGTIGYLAPEHAMGLRVGVEAEVYSYGVLLMEILTKLRPTDHTSFDGATSLVKHVEMAYPYRLLEILDAIMLQGSTSHSTQETMDMVIIPVVRIGLACCRTAASQRIRMDEVVKELNDIKKTWEDHFAEITGATGRAADGRAIH